MRKIKYFLLMLLSIVIIDVKAEKVDYYLSTKDLNYNYLNSASQKVTNVKRGDYIYVTSVINTKDAENLQIKNGKLTIRWENDFLKLVNYDSDKIYSLSNSDYQITVNDVSQSANKITLNYSSNDVIKSGSNRLIAFKFQVLDSANVGNTKIYEMDGEDAITCQNGEETSNCANSLYTELKYFIESSDTNTLSAIRLDGHALNNFKEDIKTYDINVEGKQDSINIEAVKKDERSSLGGDLGTKELSYGTNTFKIQVTSESGKDNTYTLNIKRPDNRSSENTLSTLKLSTGIINFKPEVNEYNVTLTNDIEKITITSSLKDEKAKYDVDYTKKDIELVEGINKIQIKVIAENGDENTYTLNITRELSSNNTLKEIVVNGTKLDIKDNEFYYSYEVENNITKVDVSVKATNEKAEVEVDKLDYLEEGENEIGIVVTAPNGNAVSYNLIITRKKSLSNNANLKDLQITGYKLNFNSETKYYTLKIKDEDKLEIKTILEDEKSEVTIEGNKNLINGSVIKVNVKAEDGTITRYFINIEKKGKGNILFWIVILILAIVMISIITLLVMKKNDKKKKDIVEDNDELKKEKEEENNNIINDDEKMIDNNLSSIEKDIIKENLEVKEENKVVNDVTTLENSSEINSEKKEITIDTKNVVNDIDVIDDVDEDKKVLDNNE